MASPINIKNWSPFKIDALGMVMLLGADAIRKPIGRLVYSPFEYLPLLPGHIFADNSSRRSGGYPGLHLYDFRDSIDKAIKKLDDQETKKTEVKLFITSPNGKRLTVVTTTGIAQEVLLTEARPSSENLHLVSRAFCWLAFGVHAVTLGMAWLAIQLLIITVTLVSSVAMIQG
ncbi:hypothetical protein J4E91_005592 [Alternaria rosae]|nr:hypothetical protein J4E91_005592 [Alternaria rosae]